MIHHIEYDLQRPGKNYEELIEAIKGLGAWARPTQSCWLVQTSLASAAVRDRLWRLMDPNDRLLVVHVTGEAWASAGLPAEVTDWLKTHM